MKPKREKITKSWSQICVLEALFLGEERRRSLATHGDVEMEGDCVRNHGEWWRMVLGREVWWENGEGDERKVRENEMKREKKLSKMKLVRVLNEVSLG